MRGKKSTNVHKRIAGTDQPCRMDGEIDLPVLLKLPDPPKYLSKTAIEFYNSILSKSLLKKGILNEFTLSTWIFGCQLIAIWIDYSKKNKTSNKMAGNIQEYRIARDSYQNAMVIFRDFGLTPIAMTKIVSLIRKDSKDNPYEKFLQE